ncbi:antitoxin VbhA family protein [Microbacterium aurum]|nr:hypothetical protein [Microbacterium aurum]MBM7826665.1 hypothetical protein [Microbacterium aurum]
MERFDLEERWPELFDVLDENNRWALRQSLASAWHEGWEPNRDDVELLVDHIRGVIDDAEYERRFRALAEQMRGQS